MTIASCRARGRRVAMPPRLLTVAAASNPQARGVEFAAGVLTATTTASALRVRVGRLLDPRRDRGARARERDEPRQPDGAGARRGRLDAVAPAVIFVETPAGQTTGPAAAVAPAIEVRGAPEPAPPRSRTFLRESWSGRHASSSRMRNPRHHLTRQPAHSSAQHLTDRRRHRSKGLRVQLTLSHPCHRCRCPHSNRLPFRRRQLLFPLPGKR